jgi:hypothetical protein
MTPRQLEALLEELDVIDRRAHKLALERLDARVHRRDLADEAQPMARRLDELATLLGEEDPTRRRQRSSQISESTVDLQYVLGRTRYTSLRVGRRIREQEQRG